MSKKVPGSQRQCSVGDATEEGTRNKVDRAIGQALIKETFPEMKDGYVGRSKASLVLTK